MKKRSLSALVAAIAAGALLTVGFGAVSDPSTQADRPSYCPSLGSIDLPCMV